MDQLRSLLDTFDTPVRDALGLWLAQRIVERTTEDNVDKFGRKFAKYKPSTLLKKRKSGGAQKAGDVDLMDTTRMMDSVKYRNGAVIIAATSRQAIAGYHILGTPNMQSRDFFGVGRGSTEQRMFDAEAKRLVDAEIVRAAEDKFEVDTPPSEVDGRAVSEID